MTKDDALAALDAYDAVIEVFNRRTADLPFYVTQEGDAKGMVRLSIDGDDLVIARPHLEYAHGDSYMGSEEERVPLALLLVDDADFTAMCDAKRVEWKRQSEDHRRRVAIEAEAKERTALAALKAKYEGKQ